jgi:hypothetical protein
MAPKSQVAFLPHIWPFWQPDRNKEMNRQDLFRLGRSTFGLQVFQLQFEIHIIMFSIE